MDIRDAIGVSFSWSQFVKEMEKRGYTWKLNRKYPALKTPDMERYVRLRSLGKGYGRQRSGRRSCVQRSNRCMENTGAVSKEETYRTSKAVFFLSVSDGSASAEAETDFLCGPVPISENWISASGRWSFCKRGDQHQGRAGSIPETFGGTGAFLNEGAKNAIPKRTGRYADSGDQRGIKRTSEEDPFKPAD